MHILKLLLGHPPPQAKEAVCLLKGWKTAGCRGAEMFYLGNKNWKKEASRIETG
jgi:hypothetical protein